MERSSRTKWLAREDDELRRVAETLDLRGISRLLPGRSPDAIRRRLTALGLYRATARVDGTYTLMECAAIFGVPWGTAREWVDTGKLPHIRVPSLKVQNGRGRVLVRETDLDAFITQYPFVFSLATFPEGKHKGTLIMARPQDWVSRQQAARILRMCPAHLTDLTRLGRLPGRRFGHPVFYHRADIERYRQFRSHLYLVKPQYGRRWAYRHRVAS